MIFHEKQHGFCARLFLSAQTLGTEIGKEIRNIPTTSQTLENFRVFFSNPQKQDFPDFSHDFPTVSCADLFFRCQSRLFLAKTQKHEIGKTGAHNRNGAAHARTHTHTALKKVNKPPNAERPILPRREVNCEWQSSAKQTASQPLLNRRVGVGGFFEEGRPG